MVTITKKLVGPTSMMPNEATFRFHFDKVSVNELNSRTGLDGMPEIPDQTVTIGNGNFTSKKVDGATTTLRQDVKLDLKTLAFTHAGVYKYNVTEPGTVPGIVMSTADYKLMVYVKNKPAGGVEVDKVTVEQEKEDAGTAGVGKVNPNPNPGTDTPDNPGEDVDGGSGFLFVNKIVPGNTEFILKKIVDGEYGDHSRDFDLTLTITVPSTAAPVPPAGYTGTVNPTTSYTFVPGTPTPSSCITTRRSSSRAFPWAPSSPTPRPVCRATPPAQAPFSAPPAPCSSMEPRAPTSP